MKAFFFVLFFLSVTVAPAHNIGASETNADALLQSFFIALKEGNSTAILSHFTEPILSQKRSLLENNRTYSKFLVDTYQNASMVVNRVVVLSEFENAVDVEFYFGKEDPPLKTRFVIKNLNGIWKISSEESF